MQCLRPFFCSLRRSLPLDTCAARGSVQDFHSYYNQFSSFLCQQKYPRVDRVDY